MHIPIFEQKILVDLKKLMFLQAVWKYTQIILRNMRPIRHSQILINWTCDAATEREKHDQVDLAACYAAACSVQH